MTISHLRSSLITLSLFIGHIMMGANSMIYSNFDVSILLIIAFVFGIIAAGGIYIIIMSPLRQSRERRAYMQGFFDGREGRRCNADHPL